MADFGKFGKAQIENKNLDFTFSFDGDEFDCLQPSKYRLIPEGKYAFTVVGMEKDVTRNGANMLRVTLSIDLDEGEVRVADNLVLTAKAKWKIATFFAAIGMWDEVKDHGVQADTWEKCIGKTGEFVNSHREHDGKKYNQVARYVTTDTSSNAPAVR